MKNIRLYAIIVALFTGCSGSDGWTYLFNGNDLTGWIKRGAEAKFKFENGEVIGVTGTCTHSTFLCAEKEYGDFILEFELKIDTGLNSGVQIRSHSRPEVKDGVGYDRVYGYQVEVDPSERGWSAGIYDEARNGWLYPVTPHNPAAVTAFKNHEWNHYRVEAIGNNIKTWLNGMPVADLMVDFDDSGFIALQVHSIKVGIKPWLEGKTIRWRNLRIMTENLEANRKMYTPPVHQVNVIQIKLIHSHNDYRQSLPFYQAYAQRLSSIEADIYTTEKEGELLVAHDREELETAPTLDESYIEPIVSLYKLNNGRAWRGSDKYFVLLIDLKTPVNPTLDRLIKKLQKYPEVFDPAVNPYAVRVVISGNRPNEDTFNDFPSTISFDGSQTDYTPRQLERIFMISLNFRNYSRWNGEGNINEDELKKVKEAIAAAHALGKPIRFWGSPDTPNAWQIFHQLGIDYINTDQPEACAAFFRKLEK